MSKDERILQKLKEGNHSGYKELFDLYFIPLCVYSLKYCNSFEQSEDIVQDLFLKIWNEKLYLKLEGSMGPYLYKAVKNNTLKALNKKSKHLFIEIEYQAHTLLEDDVVDLKSLEEDKKQLYQTIEALPKKSREVFKLIVLKNLKYKEVALTLNVSVNTIKTHYSRALKQLRNSPLLFILIFFSI